MEVVDGNQIGLYDGIVTIFCGYDSNAKIKRFMLTAFGTDDDKYITLNDCRKMIGEPDCAVTVIFEDYLLGEIYNYGNYGKKWWQVGDTCGFA
jgi:hypothetical protein